MKELLIQKEIISFKLLQAIVRRLIYGAMFTYYVADLLDKPFKAQITYISICVVGSVLMDYLSANNKQPIKIQIIDNHFKLMGADIDLSKVNEILYSQTKRFERTIRFRYSNDTYQDFELSNSDLIEDLRFYQFLVDNQLPVKMLDNEDRLS